ncbi:MAG: AtpZ/AtpI family protein [Planctomycetes bacterium]|nr:AtpZ/AtpI family protein [Planctomycetota bacterium]MCP4771634.1 AtpZ/AtpI family protein [Planctomycetota bacterium]MCP4860066.1 AtpZ/AtpI family protein [Planctomycetota bacterium]
MSKNRFSENEDKAPGSRHFNDYARLSGIGLEFSASVALVGWLGWLLDRWTGLADSFPVFLLIGVFLGLGLGIYRLQLKVSTPPPKEKENPDPEDDDQ